MTKASLRSTVKSLLAADCRQKAIPLALGGMMLSAGVGVAYAEGTTTLAIAAPMAGASTSIGNQYKVGVTAALQNLQGGKLLGKKVVITTHDDRCNDEIAAKVATSLTQTPPAAVIGHSCSLATVAAAPIYAKHNILQITPASTSPKVTEQGIKTIFRMIGRDDVQGKLAAERLLQKFKGKKIGVVYFRGAYSEGLTGIAIQELAKHGVKPAKIMKSAGESSYYVTEIDAFMSEGIDVVYMVGGGASSGMFIRQARKMGAEFDMISSDTLVSKVFRDVAGADGDGIPFTFPPEAIKLPTSQKAVKAIRGMGAEPIGYTLLAYAAAEAWISAVQQAQTLDTAKVSEILHTQPIKTILGTITFDAKGDIVTPYAPFTWYVWKDGQRVEIE